MKKMIIRALALSGLFVCGSTMWAQNPPQLDRPPIQGEPGGQVPVPRGISPAQALSPVTILNMMCEDTDLRREADISMEQIQNLQKLMADLGSRQQTVRMKYGALTRSPENAEKLRKELNEIREKLMPGIAAVLTPEQMKRFSIVQYQILGGLDSPLVTMDTLRVFDLDEEQKQKMEALFKDRVAKIASLVTEHREQTGSMPKPEELMKIREQGIVISKQFGEQARALLTPEQHQIEEQIRKEAPQAREKFEQFLKRRQGAAPPAQ